MRISKFLSASVLLLLSVQVLAINEYRNLNYDVYQIRVETTGFPIFYLKPKPKLSVLRGQTVDAAIQQYPLEPIISVTDLTYGANIFFVTSVNYNTTPITETDLLTRYDLLPSVSGDFDGDGDTDLAALFKTYVAQNSGIAPTALLYVYNKGRTVSPLVFAHRLFSDNNTEVISSIHASDVDGDGIVDMHIPPAPDSLSPRKIDPPPETMTTSPLTLTRYISAPDIGDSFIDPSDILPKVVGATGGSYSVGVDGAASYTIPIAIPVGAGNQQPNLSLSYSSNGGNGNLGFGWQLTGLSRMHRCGKTLKQDGINTAVDFTSNDQLCMDGQRLILKSGTHGANGAEYRLENEVFIKVIAQGGSAGGMPASFLVYSPDGSVMRYGYNSDSRIEANGDNASKVLEWALDRVQDRWGNYSQYIYQEDVDAGSYHVDSIEYGGNLNASTPHTNRVQFNYGSRGNGYLGYMLGSVLSNPNVLTEVQVYEGSTKLRFYAMKYEVAEHNHVIYLKGVTECSGANVCLRPTKLEWETPGIGFANTSSWFTEGSANLYSDGAGDHEHWADMNGDGKTDRVWQPSCSQMNCLAQMEGIWVALANSTGTGFDTATQWMAKPSGIVATSRSGQREILADVNGDGLTDYLWQPNDANGQLYVALNTGTSLSFQSTPWLTNTIAGETIYFSTDTSDGSNGRHEAFVDINNDGLVDKVWRPQNRSAYFVSLNTGTSFGAAQKWYDVDPDFASYSTDGEHESYADVTGDGLLDKVWIPNNQHLIRVAKNTGSSFAPATVWLTKDNVETYASKPSWEGYADFNSDGLMDRYWMPDGNSGFYVALSTGKSFQTPTIWLKSLPSNQSIYSQGGKSEYFMDVNDDGYIDRVWRPNNDLQKIYVALSTGSAFLEPTKWLTQAAAGVNVNSTNSAHETFADVNGDGILDRVWIPSDHENKIYVSLNQAKPSSELIKIINGFGHETKFTYAPLTDSSTYDKHAGLTPAYPLNNNYKPFVQDARCVVKKVEVSNGIGGFSSTSYKYYGLRYDSANKANLGFAKIKVTNDVTGMYDITTYNQGDVNPKLSIQTTDADQQGLIVETYTKSGGMNDYTLSYTINSWVVEILHDSVNTAQSRYVRKLLSTILSKRDLNNNLLYSEINSYTYDSYGHIDTQVTTTKNPDYTWVKQSTIDNDYVNDENLWLLGLTSRIKVTDDTMANAYVDGYNPAAITRVSKWNYNAQGVLLNEQIWNSTETTMASETAYSNYDAFGHARTVTVSTSSAAESFASRSSTVVYDSSGRFVTTTTNALNQSASTAYYVAGDGFSNGAYPGMVKTVTDANGLKMHYSYDSFGRVNETIAGYTSAAPVSSTSEFILCSSGCPSYAVYAIKSHTQGSGEVWSYLDVLGREVRKSAQGFDGSFIHMDREYNSKGQNWRVSDPYFDSATPRSGIPYNSICVIV